MIGCIDDQTTLPIGCLAEGDANACGWLIRFRCDPYAIAAGGQLANLVDESARGGNRSVRHGVSDLRRGVLGADAVAREPLAQERLATSRLSRSACWQID
jgi:hypothetical protein